MNHVYLKPLFIIFLVVILSACGGGSSSDSQLPPPAFTIASSFNMTQLSEGEAVEILFQTANAEGAVSLEATITDSNIPSELLSLTTDGLKVIATLGDLEKAGAVSLQVTATDDGGNSDSLAFTFAVENTSVLPIVDKLNAFSSNRVSILEQTQEKEVLSRIAKVIYYENSGFTRSELDSLLSLLSRERTLEAQEEYLALDNLLSLVWDNDTYTETELKHALLEIEESVAQHMEEINSLINTVSKRSVAAVPELKLGTYYYEQGILSQFWGNPLFSNGNEIFDWAGQFKFLDSIVWQQPFQCNTTG